MANRPPSTPPQIPGFTYERLLGSGGFADVFRYTQQLPKRSVAVKVLLEATTDAASREQFVAEANVMAQLSAHPSIVTIYHADTAADGRPFLVMEYCPRPNLSVRYRTERLDVAESLRIGVRLGGAVETAHRAGILHRDIKPANVLTTDYGWPALTDFGISVVKHTAGEAEAVGMSIPWSAPEFFDERAHRGVPGDVYALAATVYTLLAGRSPFEQGPGKNSALDLIARIEHDPVPPLDRDDVPASLSAALTRGMAKNPQERFASAAEFARALQRVEQELQLAQTSLDLPDTSGIEVPENIGEDLRTRVRSVAEIPPAPPPASAPPDPDVTRARTPAVVSPQEAASAQQDAPDQPAVAGTTHAATGAGDDADPGTRPRRGLRWLTLAASALVVAVVGGVVIYGAINAPEESPKPTYTTSPPEPTTQGAARPGPVEDLRGERDDDEVTFTWQAPEFDGDLEYAWRQVPAAEEGTERIDDTEITLTAADQVCVAVAAIATDGDTLSEWTETCG